MELDAISAGHCCLPFCGPTNDRGGCLHSQQYAFQLHRLVTLRPGSIVSGCMLMESEGSCSRFQVLTSWEVLFDGR